MFPICRHVLSINLQKLGERTVSSIIPQLKLKEFDVHSEPVLGYMGGSRERCKLEATIESTASTCQDVPIVVGDEEIRTKNMRYQVMPHCHSHKVAQFYYADKKTVEKAITVAVKAQTKWDRTSINDRIKIWDKAADLVSCIYRQELNAATMMGQSKTMIQAELDSAAKLIDFLRFNAYFLNEHGKYELFNENVCIERNSTRYRGLEGFVATMTPFNITAFAANVVFTPVLMGNAVVWKPADTAILSNWIVFKIMREAGVPAGVINFVPCEGPLFADMITTSPYLAGISFAGSTPTFKRLWSQVGQNVDTYNNFPRLVGELSAKNFHFVHTSADVESVVAGTLRAAFEYSGQKSSACSRLYVPESLWPEIKQRMLCIRDGLKIGDPKDYDTFSSAVIDANAFKRIKEYINYACRSEHVEVISGGRCDDAVGYFVEPTILLTKDPCDKLMTEEIFGPILTVYVYPDKDLDKALTLVGCSTKYALCGSIFAKDDTFLKRAVEGMKTTVGNLFINDKCTGADSGKQPFGGGRMSGTNDKSGGPHYLLRWTSSQTIKETFIPIRSVEYPYMRTVCKI